MYHLMGLINVATFMLTVAGLWFQLAMVRERTRRFACGELTDGRPTSILSLNQMSSVYLACFAFFFYGLSLNPVNHYLAWPRFMAVLLVIAILHYMAADRRTLIVRSVYGLTIALLLILPTLFYLYPESLPDPTRVGQLLVLTATFVLGQGYWHQVHTIRSTGRTGAVSLRFHQCVCLTAFSTVLFGISMGWHKGWPLIVLASVSMSMKLITMWHFRWVRLSPLAATRRMRTGDQAPLPAG